MLDWIEVSAERGLKLTPGACATLGLVPPLAGAFAWFIGLGRARAALSAWGAGLAAGWAVRVAPLVMLLKDPLFFPKLLRWGKEDQFLSPLLCLLIAGAAWSLPRAWMRWSAAAVVVAVAGGLEARDFPLHANSLLL